MEGEAHYFFLGVNGWVVWLIGALLTIVPFWKLLPRSGMSSWLALFSVIPPVAILLLWFMAFRNPDREAR